MSNPQQFNLIDGTFTPSDAGQILHALVNGKIDFHSMEKYSKEERFGRDVASSEKRLIELRALDASLKELFALASGRRQNLKIEGRIKITFVE